MKTDKLKTITEEEIKNNPQKARENFIYNLDNNEELRLQLWEKMYWDIKNKMKYRNNKQIMLSECEKQYLNMNKKEKLQWYDFVSNDSKALGVVGEINYIAQLVKMHKGNMKKVWRDLKAYGKQKKEENNK